MTDLEHTFIETNGIKLHVVLAGPAAGEPVLLLHGFPEYWGGWKQQIPALAEAGFRVIVPDQRGYGQSSVPRGVDAYALPKLPASPRILDIACGPGSQTIAPARATQGAIIAIDTHQPFLDELARRDVRHGI